MTPNTSSHTHKNSNASELCSAVSATNANNIISAHTFPPSFSSPAARSSLFPLSSIMLASLLISLTSVSGCSHQEANAPAPRPALAYQIKSDAGSETELYAGDIRARVEVDHAFRVGGKIIQRMVDAGATVKKGQALARIDPEDIKLAANAAASQVAAQKTEADFAENELKRYRDLFIKGFVSQSALDQKISVTNAAKARLEAVRSQAAVSLNQAGYATLVAEMDGVVTQVMAEAGQVVAQGQAVMRIANPNEKELAISASESKVADFRKIFAQSNAKKAVKDAAKNAGVNLRVALWSQPGKYYPARIREIGGAADPVTRTYAIRLSLQNPDEAIQLGMTAYAVFGAANESDTLSVPLSSIYVKGDPRGDVVGVWLIAADGKISLKPITVLQYRETTAFIEPVQGAGSGIKAGDLIVAAGVHKLREGEIVKPVIDALIKGDGKVSYVSPDTTTDATTIALKR